MARIKIKDHIRESRLFNSRILVSAAMVLLLLLLLLARLVQLQIVDHQHFTTLSRDNRVKVEPLPPPRGLIYDRKGVVLAQNLPTHSLEIIPERITDIDQTLAELGAIVDISDKDIERFQRLRKQRRRFESIPIRVRLTAEEVARFAVNRHRFPGVVLQAKLLRDYPLAENTAHVLGYVGRINEQELRRIDASAYSGTSHIGKTGVEKYHEADLHGEVGLRRVEINVVGRPIRTLESVPPVPGKNIYLSLDAELQQLAVQAMGDNNGAVVAIDPRDGSILAMVSKPGFDPNLFVEGISPENYRALQTSPDKPLFNRALRGRYPPGSTAKPFIGLAGLEYKLTYFGKKVYCPGYFQLPGHDHKYRDWKKEGHGPMDLGSAIVQSCDVYFYDLSLQLGIDRIHSFLSRFGFGQKSGVDIAGDLPGLLPSQEWKRRTRQEPWFAGETLIVGIGQGYFLTTPLELASATATLAARGTRHSPRIVQATSDSAPGQGELQRLPPPVATPIPPIDERNLQDVIEAMADVVEGTRGTARGIRTREYRIAGKTGTAQVFTVKQDEEYEEEKVAKKMRDHALFIAFAPVQEPRIAVAVIVENGGHGGSVAAPIARRVMDQYLLNGGGEE
jgi:penicillin-binding protein 2